MALPDFTRTGDLPSGIHRAALNEVVQRFGAPQGPRHVCSQHLYQVFILAEQTGHLYRFLIFGSYITVKPLPNDVDVVLVMDDDFHLDECAINARGLFDHTIAQARYGTSIFWIRLGLLVDENVDEFIAHWQIKRDGSLRGIVEVIL